MVEKPIIIALDFNNEASVLQLLDQLDPASCRVKIGKELFTACGPELVRTVASACRAAAELGVWMLNVHASGGLTMMQAARDALADYGEKRPLLIAVTVLTSLAREDLQQIGIDSNPEEQVSKLAFLTRQAGLDGVVCSAAETRLLRAQMPDDFCLVTPGIRRPEDAANDQKRVVGPSEAIKNGSTYLVVGRPVTQASDPAQALADFNSALTGD